MSGPVEAVAPPAGLASGLSVLGRMGVSVVDEPAFRVLGPLQVTADGLEVGLTAKRQRTVLGMLLLSPNRVVSVGRLVAAVWESDPPSSSRVQVQICVSAVRRVLLEGRLGGDRVRTAADGYLIRVGPEELDSSVFQRKVREARKLAAADDAMEAAGMLRDALDLWRGPALSDLNAAAVRPGAGMLDEARLAAQEEYFDLVSGLGRHGEVIGQLGALVAEYPLRERFTAQLMLALYRAGRTAEALEVYQSSRRAHVEELGIEPGSGLRDLQDRLLRDERGLDLPTPVAPPPARSTSVPRQLPAAVRAFVGRAGQLKELNELPTLVTAGSSDTSGAGVVAVIAGTAGVGKTALALQWAHQVAGWFPDGQLFADLHGYSPAGPVRPAEALGQFLRALGVEPDRVPVDVEEAAGLYRTLLADQNVLVVLDNAVSAAQVRPLLPGTGTSMALVTSRDRLTGLVAHDGAHHVALDALTPTEARELLVAILGHRRVDAEPGAVTELARLCAYLPLALRVTAANLAHRPALRVADHIAELAAGSLLTALAVEGDTLPVRAAFDQSYLSVSEPARRLFRLLGPAPGYDITVDAAAALLDTTPDVAGNLLHRLAAAHLVGEPVIGRFTFHDLLRQYATERAERDDPEAERTAASRRLADWRLHTTRDAARALHPRMLLLSLPATTTTRPPAPAFAARADALAWLDAERPNLVAAVRHAAEYGPPEVAWSIADSMRGYLRAGQFPADWRTVADCGLGAARAAGEARAEAICQLSLANLGLYLGDYQQAVDSYASASTLAARAGWPECEFASANGRGLVHARSGRLDQAVEDFTQALALGEVIGGEDKRVSPLGNLGGVHLDRGEPRKAIACLEQALAICRRTGDRNGQAIQLANLGEAYLLLGQVEQALAHTTEAVAAHREAGDGGGEADALRQLADAHREAGRPDHAKELAHAALAAIGRGGQRRSEADALNTLGSIQQVLGRGDDAAGYHRRALDLAAGAGIHHAEVEALLGLAATDRAAPDLASPLAAAERALSIARRYGYRMLEGRTLTVLAALHRDRGDLAAALDLAGQALDSHRATGHRPGETRTLTVIEDIRHRIDTCPV
jgi:DNA-binding SARP family transcriptional activator/tetratricopeptide (TPR) repeat protein